VAAEVPEAVAGLVLIGVNPGLPDTDPEERRARCAIEQEWAARLRRDGLEAFIRYWTALPLFETQRRLPEEVRAERQRIRSQHRAEPLARVLLALGTGSMPDYRRAVVNAGVPVQLITGELDTKFDAIARAWSSEAAGVEHLVIPGAGHDPTVEAPESLARAVAHVLHRKASR
jgi:2-succinyl-6-hydroxy-2,4-cyclohexadiene-1-carboxylate synthase